MNRHTSHLEVVKYFTVKVSFGGFNPLLKSLKPLVQQHTFTSTSGAKKKLIKGEWEFLCRLKLAALHVLLSHHN